MLKASSSCPRSQSPLICGAIQTAEIEYDVIASPGVESQSPLICGAIQTYNCVCQGCPSHKVSIPSDLRGYSDLMATKTKRFSQKKSQSPLICGAIQTAVMMLKASSSCPRSQSPLICGAIQTAEIEYDVIASPGVESQSPLICGAIQTYNCVCQGCPSHKVSIPSDLRGYSDLMATKTKRFSQKKSQSPLICGAIQTAVEINKDVFSYFPVSIPSDLRGYSDLERAGSEYSRVTEVSIPSDLRGYSDSPLVTYTIP